jgi:8-oxo-dGTP pyrophosphatase MutT (NUDIX family)
MHQDPAEFQVSLKVLLTNKKGEHLVLFAKSKSSMWHGKYDFPGGRINNDEINVPFHKLIDREIREEVGTTVRYTLRPDPVSMSMCQYPGEGKKIFILFEAKYRSGTIKISGEHWGYEWISITPSVIKNKFPSVFKDMIKNYLVWNNKKK